MNLSALDSTTIMFSVPEHPRLRARERLSDQTSPFCCDTLDERKYKEAMKTYPYYA